MRAGIIKSVRLHLAVYLCMCSYDNSVTYGDVHVGMVETCATL
jgi:hypothetical protein